MFEAPRPFKPALIAGALPAGPPPTIDFLKIWSVLWRGRMTIVWTTAASLLLAFAFVLVAPQRFTATTEILIDPSDLRAVANEPTPSTKANDPSPQRQPRNSGREQV